eukprot:COSAG01_NODE_2110_length_8408_cov_19.542183_7_plen_169_part_00
MHGCDGCVELFLPLVAWFERAVGQGWAEPQAAAGQQQQQQPSPAEWLPQPLHAALRELATGEPSSLPCRAELSRGAFLSVGAGRFCQLGLSACTAISIRARRWRRSSFRAAPVHAHTQHATQSTHHRRLAARRCGSTGLLRGHLCQGTEAVGIPPASPHGDQAAQSQV